MHITARNNLIYSDETDLPLRVFDFGAAQNTFTRNINNNGVFYSRPVNQLNYVHFGGTSFGNFSLNHSQLQSQSFAFDQNAVLTNPNLFTYNDLPYPSNPDYIQAGGNISTQVPLDFVGIPRNIANPCIGALESQAGQCLPPSNLEPDSIMGTSIRVRWGSFENDAVIWYGPQGMSAGTSSGTTLSISNAKKGLITNLTPNQCYDIYVRNACDSINPTWEGPLNFCAFHGRDLEVLEILDIDSIECVIGLSELQVVVRNNGTFKSQTIEVQTIAQGANTNSQIQSIATDIEPNAIDTLTIPLFALQNSGPTSLSVIVQYSGDTDPQNDTGKVTFMALSPDIQVYQGNYCGGNDSAIFTATPLPGITYAWYLSSTQPNPMFVGNQYSVPSPPTNFTVYVEYAGIDCKTQRVAFPLQQNPQPTPGFSFAENQLEVYFNYTGNVFDSVFWTLGYGGFTASGLNPMHLYPSAGNYEVCVQAFGDCGTAQFCQNINVSGAIGLPETPVKPSFTLYPNPSTGKVIIQLEQASSEKQYVEIIDSRGRLVYQEAFGCTESCDKELDLSHLAKGVYIFRIKHQGAWLMKRWVRS
jgi:hypothetical protein